MDNEQLEIGLVGAFLSWRQFAQMNFQCFTFLWIDFRQKQQQQWEGTGANFSWLKHSRHIFEILFAYFFQPGHISPGKIMLSRFSDFFQIFLQPGSCTALQVSDGEDVFIRILKIFLSIFKTRLVHRIAGFCRRKHFHRAHGQDQGQAGRGSRTSIGDC